MINETPLGLEIESIWGKGVEWGARGGEGFGELIKVFSTSPPSTYDMIMIRTREETENLWGYMEVDWPVRPSNSPYGTLLQGTRTR